MESDHEQNVIALKSFLHNLGFDKNDPQRTIDQNRSSANLAVSKINSHLFSGESKKNTRSAKLRFKFQIEINK